MKNLIISSTNPDFAFVIIHILSFNLFIISSYIMHTILYVKWIHFFDIILLFLVFRYNDLGGIFMKKAMILLADGFEEIEAFATVDILRRASITCHMISLDSDMVRGCHDIQVMSDYSLKDIDTSEYDMIILPGGLPGADNLMNSNKVISLIQDFAVSKRYVAAICAAPQVLAKASIVSGRRVTSYPTKVYKDILVENGADYVDNKLVCIDGNIITSRGPATVFDFAYTLVDVLDGDSNSLKGGMLYNDLKK